MDLIKPAPPKGIYDQELHFVEGELRMASFGDMEKLGDRQVSEVMDRLRIAMAPHTDIDMKWGFKYAGQAQVDAIIGQLTSDHTLGFMPHQIDHVKTVLTKYVGMEKHPGLFSL